MSEDIYQQALKDLAQAAHGAGRLSRPDGEALRHNPLCGDRVRMEVVASDGRITALAQETRCCLLARASASLLGLRAQGCGRDEIAAMARALQALLAGGEANPSSWPELALFRPVAAHPSRQPGMEKVLASPLKVTVRSGSRRSREAKET